MIGSALLLLLLGVLIGAGLLFAAVLVPAIFRILPASMARAFIGSVFSLYYLFATAISGAALALMVLIGQCLSPMLPIVLAMCCAAYVLAWRELTPRLMVLRDRGDTAGLRHIETAIQFLNTAQLAVFTALFVQVLQACV